MTVTKRTKNNTETRLMDPVYSDGKSTSTDATVILTSQKLNLNNGLRNDTFFTSVGCHIIWRKLKIKSG